MFNPLGTETMHSSTYLQLWNYRYSIPYPSSQAPSWIKWDPQKQKISYEKYRNRISVPLEPEIQLWIAFIFWYNFQWTIVTSPHQSSQSLRRFTASLTQEAPVGIQYVQMNRMWPTWTLFSFSSSSSMHFLSCFCLVANASISCTLNQGNYRGLHIFQNSSFRPLGKLNFPSSYENTDIYPLRTFLLFFSFSFPFFFPLYFPFSLYFSSPFSFIFPRITSTPAGEGGIIQYRDPAGTIILLPKYVHYRTMSHLMRISASFSARIWSRCVMIWDRASTFPYIIQKDNWGLQEWLLIVG